MPIVQTPEIIDPLAMSPEHAAAFLSLSRRALSNLIADGAILAKKHGVRTLVDVASIRVYYASCVCRKLDSAIFMVKAAKDRS
jgi:hypothetical protein